jgi:hypothetical protein
MSELTDEAVSELCNYPDAVKALLVATDGNAHRSRITV